MSPTKLKHIIDLLLYAMLVCVLSIIIVRALPYQMIKALPFLSVNVEVFLYGFIVALMTKVLIQPSSHVVNALASPNIEPKEEDRAKAGFYQPKDGAICGALFLFSIIYLLPGFNKGIPNLDEGFILAASERMLRGELPYRDFFLLMTPGSFYFNTWVFLLFGATVLTERTFTLLMAAVATSAFYLFARMGMSFLFSIGISLIYLAWQFPLWFHANYSWYAAVFSMLAFWMALMAFLGTASKRFFLLCGLFCGLAIVSKQNNGVFTTTAIAVCFCLDAVFFGAREPRRNPSANFQNRWKQFAMFSFGLFIPVALSGYVFIREGYLVEYGDAIFFAPWRVHSKDVTGYLEFSRLTDKRLMAYMPFLLMAVTAGNLSKRLFSGALKRKDCFPLVLLLAAVFNLLNLYPTADFIHALFTFWPSLLLLGYWLQRSAMTISPESSQTSGPGGVHLLRIRKFAMVFPSLLIFALFFGHRTKQNISFEKELTELMAPRGKGIYDEKESAGELNEVVFLCRERLRQADTKGIFTNSPLLYFLMETPNPTPYDYILFGSVRDEYVEQIIDSLEKEKPHLAIFDRNNYRAPERWEEVLAYISSRYQPVFISTQGRYTVMERNDPRREADSSALKATVGAESSLQVENLKWAEGEV